MPKPRRKNISREIRDIRFPTSHVPKKPVAAARPVRNIRPVAKPPQPSGMPRVSSKSFPKRQLVFFISIILIASIAGSILWYRDKIAKALQLRIVLLQALHIESPIKLPGAASDAPSSLGDWLSFIKNSFSSFGSLGQSSVQLLGMVGQAQTALEDLPAAILQKNGAGFIADLGVLRDTLKSVDGALESIGKNGDSSAVLPGFSEYLAYQPDVERAQNAVDALIALFQSSGQHHILVLFGNSAELRPGGGFLGSFADASFGNSTIGDISIHDINEVDRGFTANIVPPKPLQGIVSRWRSADANWFFDYPTSAAKTLEFMSQSSFYASSTLDGAILISPKVIQDILTVTGPVALADGSTTITADTVMPLIQREVQAGQATGAADPKAIIAALLPPLEMKLQNLDADAQNQLLTAAQAWIANKDVEVFMKDPALDQVLAYYHADGGLYAMPSNFSGDYLAAVNANVGGGKSDAFISDEIDIQSDLRADGLIDDQVTVSRANAADTSDEWWYQLTNQDYLQVFTPLGATLSSGRGSSGNAHVVTPRINYVSGFATDPDLAAVESTLAPITGIPGVSQFRESGKNVFATWVTTAAGKTDAAYFEYQRSLSKPFRDGDTYMFIFERQSGADQALDAVLNAPPGFVWQINGLSKYEYINPSVPGRVVLTLALKAL